MATTKVWAQPLIVVADVVASSEFYRRVLGVDSGHGGDEYDQLVSDGEIILQLHDNEADAAHGPLAPRGIDGGHGVVLWFEVDDIDDVAERVRASGATVRRELAENPNAKHREIWFEDLDRYLVVAAGPSTYRPR